MPTATALELDLERSKCFWNLLSGCHRVGLYKKENFCILLYGQGTKLFHIRCAKRTLKLDWSPAGLSFVLRCIELQAGPNSEQGGAQTNTPSSFNLEGMKLVQPKKSKIH